LAVAEMPCRAVPRNDQAAYAIKKRGRETILPRGRNSTAVLGNYSEREIEGGQTQPALLKSS